MGGYGSGRHSDKLKIEECPSLDVNQLRRDGCLNNGWSGTSRWWCNHVEVGSVGLSMSADHLHLSYRSRSLRREWEEVNQLVLIERVPCRFGGWRPYFRCACNRRVVKLYSAGQLLLCRHCYNLPYSSKNEGFWDRSLRQRDRHRVRLSGNASTEAFEALKPKGMWWQTYQRLQECAQAAERRADDGFLVAARRLLKMG